MTVQEIIDYAKNGELKNIAVKNDTEAVLGFINLGMIELYKRFPLLVEEHVIELLDGVEIYTMPSNFMWVVAAYDEVPEDSDDIVAVIPINEEDNPLSINTVSWNTIQVPVTVAGSYISIIYAAAPVYITNADLATDIQIPPQMIEALLNYIGYRAHGSVNGEINSENNTHLMRFESSVKRIEQMGMFTSDDMNMDTKFYNRGFV